MNNLKYIAHYSDEIQEFVRNLIETGKLETYLKKRHPNLHNIRNDSALREYAIGLKSQYLKKSEPLSQVAFDSKIHPINGALGLNSSIARQQGSKLKRKNEIKIAAVFKDMPESFLKMIVVHELAHLKERNHDKSFYKLCENMLPDYHQLEFEARLYLTYLELNKSA